MCGLDQSLELCCWWAWSPAQPGRGPPVGPAWLHDVQLLQRLSFMGYTEQFLVFLMSWGRICFPNRCRLFQAGSIRCCAPLVLIVYHYSFYVALIWLFQRMWSWRFFIALIAWCRVFSCFNKRLADLFFMIHLWMSWGLLFLMRISQLMFSQCLGWMLIKLIMILRHLLSKVPRHVLDF